MPKVQSRHKSLLLIIFASCVVLFIFSNLPFFGDIKTGFVRIFTCPSAISDNVSRYFADINRLIAENEQLQKKVSSLGLELAATEDTKEENERLRQLLGFKSKFRFNTVSAEVVAREPSSWTGAFVINRGTNDGLKKQSAVCSSRGLVGKVVETGKTRSLVSLMTHPDFRVGGVIQKSRVNGVVAGGAGGMLKMLYIPMDAKVQEGDIVTTSAYSRIFPRGIYIGKVAYVGKSKTGLFKYAMIKPFADLFNEEEVLVIVDK